jgi:hypothetical protein
MEYQVGYSTRDGITVSSLHSIVIWSVPVHSNAWRGSSSVIRYLAWTTSRHRSAVMKTLYFFFSRARDDDDVDPTLL